MYCVAKSCLHTVWPPELTKISAASTEFYKNIEILQKWANSATRLKMPCSAENCGPHILLS